MYKFEISFFFLPQHISFNTLYERWTSIILCKPIFSYTKYLFRERGKFQVLAPLPRVAVLERLSLYVEYNSNTLKIVLQDTNEHAAVDNTVYTLFDIRYKNRSVYESLSQIKNYRL